MNNVPSQVRPNRNEAAYAAATEHVSNVSGDYSTSVTDRLFLLQLARKQTVESSLEAAIEGMQAKLADQQKLNQVLANFTSKDVVNGVRVLSADEVALFTKVGFNVVDGNFQGPLGGTPAAKSAYIVKDGNGNYVVPEEKLADFKTALTQHITAISGTNEIQMLQVQRLMNAANEAMQSASSQLKSSHEIAMAIIRNLG